MLLQFLELFIWCLLYAYGLHLTNQNTADLKDDKREAQNMWKLAAAAGKFIKKPKGFRYLHMEKDSNEDRTENQQQIMTLSQKNGKHLQ